MCIGLEKQNHDLGGYIGQEKRDKRGSLKPSNTTKTLFTP